MATFAIYQQTENGELRLGTVRGLSAYDASRRFWRNHPNAGPPESYRIARRVKMMGRWVDSERLPMDGPEEK